MAVCDLASSTWEDVRAFDPARAVAILPVGAIEAHGPHLPLSTDVVIARAMARAGAERLSGRGHAALLLPPLAYTAAPFASGFPGTVSVAPATVSALVLDIARSLGRQGVPLLAIANAHLDPAHVGALRAAAERIEGDEDATAVVFPDVTRRRWAERLTAEFRSGACHAGRYEGSVVLAERPEWVREALLPSLPPVERSLSDAIRDGVRTFEEAGGKRAYFGWPAEATAEEGREIVATLGTILEEAVLEALEARNAGGKSGGAA